MGRAKYPYRVFGWNPAKLCDYSYEQLNELRHAIEGDPANRNPPGSFYLFTAEARRKTDALSWAIYHKQQAEKRAVA